MNDQGDIQLEGVEVPILLGRALLVREIEVMSKNEAFAMIVSVSDQVAVALVLEGDEIEQVIQSLKASQLRATQFNIARRQEAKA